MNVSETHSLFGTVLSPLAVWQQLLNMYAKCDLHITFCETVCEVVENEERCAGSGALATGYYCLVCLLAMLRWILTHFSSFSEGRWERGITREAGHDWTVCVAELCAATVNQVCKFEPLLRIHLCVYWSNNGLLSVLIGKVGALEVQCGQICI